MGTAIDRRIKLNPVLLSFGYDEVQRTLRHELAHILAWYRHGGKSRIATHGEQWRRACTDLRIPGEKPTHLLPVRRSTHKRKYLHVCKHCGNVYNTVRPLKRKLACRRCCKRHNNGDYQECFRFMQVYP